MAPRAKKHNTKSDDGNRVFKQKFPNFKKKAMELSVLCGNSVGFVCYGPDNDLYVWPEPESLSELVTKFSRQSDEKRKKNGCDVMDFPDLKGLSLEELKNHISIIDSHLDGIEKKRIRIVRKRFFNCDHDEMEIIPRVSEKASEVEIQARVLETDEKLEDVSNDQSNMFGAFDELGYGFTGLDETVCGYGDLDSLLSNTDNWGLEFPCGQDQVFVDVDSFLSNTDKWSFEPEPLMLDSIDFAGL